MEIKIFISYYSENTNKMQMLKKLINETNHLTSIVIADRKRSLVPLTKKVEDGINEAQIIVPILTKESISSQWVNQEIGYAFALTDIKVWPIIDKSIIDDLKGFIHKQVDLSFNFQSFPGEVKKEGIHFKKCIVGLINEIKAEYGLMTPINSEIEQADSQNNELFFDDNYLRDALKIYQPKIQIKTTITPFIKNSSGILSFWANVRDHHNLIKSQKRNLFIASFYSNNYLTSPSLAKHPNMWVILRETPTPTQKNGKWCFKCNGQNKETTSIEFKKPISTGWHLFSVEWSIQMDFIRFYIDTMLIGEANFANWPEAFDSSMHIGTWPDKDPKSQFFSEVSGPLFVGEIDPRIIKETFEYNPKVKQLEKNVIHKSKPEKISNTKDSFLNQALDFNSLKLYSERYFPDRLISVQIQNILLNDIDKKRYKNLQDIHNVVLQAESFIKYYKKLRPDYFSFSTDILTKSLGYVDLKFRSKHSFASRTMKAFVDFSKNSK